MTVHHALNSREANSGTFEVRNGVKALKGAKELGGVSHVESRAVVAHEVDEAFVPSLAAERDLGMFLSGRELPGVSEKVLEDHRDQALVRVTSYGILDALDDVALGAGGLKPPQDLAGEHAQIERSAMERGTRNA